MHQLYDLRAKMGTVSLSVYGTAQMTGKGDLDMINYSSKLKCLTLKWQGYGTFFPQKLSLFFTKGSAIQYNQNKEDFHGICLLGVEASMVKEGIYGVV